MCVCVSGLLILVALDVCPVSQCLSGDDARPDTSSLSFLVSVCILLSVRPV